MVGRDGVLLDAGPPPAAPTARRVLTLAVLLTGIGGLMLFAGLIGAFMHVREFATFPPKGVTIDRYLGNLVTITMLMGSFTAEWADLRDPPRRAPAGYGWPRLSRWASASPS